MIEGVPVLVSGSEHIPVPTGTVLVDGGTPIPTLSPSPAVSAEPTAIALNVQTDTISVASVLVVCISHM